MAVASPSREEALLAENERLKQALAEERAEKEALRAETERLYRICEDEIWVEDVMKRNRKICNPQEKLVAWGYRKVLPSITLNPYGVGATEAKEISRITDVPKATVLKTLARFGKMGVIKHPAPYREKICDPVTGKPILDKRGKPKYTSKLFTGPGERFDDVSSWDVPSEMAHKPSGYHPPKDKTPIPTCPICRNPATEEHARLHCEAGHEWEIKRTFESEEESQSAFSDEDAELAALFDEAYESDAPSDFVDELESCPDASENAICDSTIEIDCQIAFSNADEEQPSLPRKSALAELQEYAQFVCWRYGALDQTTGKRKKIPLNPKTGGAASVSEPTTWGSYDEAMALKARARLVDGIGFVFTESDPFVGIDLDGCIDQAGNVSDQGAALLSAIDSYSEYSPSHTGVHILASGDLPAAIKTSGIEMYSTRRYFTFTGEQLPGTPAGIAARQSEIMALYQQIAPPLPVIATSQVCASIATDAQALLERALRDEKFRRLWNGDTSEYGGDESRADLALVRKLDFYTGGDRDRIHALFQQSALMRPKWLEKRGAITYGQITIAKVLDPPTVHTKPSLSTEPADAQSDEEQLSSLGEHLGYPRLQLSAWSKVEPGQENWQKFLRFNPTKVAAMLAVALMLIGGAV